MKKRGLVILDYLFILLLGVSLYLSDACLVSAREGLSDAELYGNGQESVLYQGASQEKSKLSPSRDKKAYAANTTSEVKSGKETEGVSSEAKSGKKAEDVSSEAKPKKEKHLENKADRKEDISGNALSEVSVSGDAYLRQEDVVIAGVAPDGIYNKDVTIAISAVKPNEALLLQAELTKVSGTQGVDKEDTEGTERLENTGTLEKSVESDYVISGDAMLGDESLLEKDAVGNWSGKPDNSRNSRIGLQIGLSVTGQMVSGKTQVSEEGSYELVVWQEVSGVQEMPEEQRVLKRIHFTLDKTAPVIDRELINELCKNKIDIEEICRKAVWDETKVTTSCFVNEQKLSKGIIKRSGEYELIVKAEDVAGNEVQEELQITLQDGDKKSEKHSRFMAPSIIVLLFGASMLIRERRKEKKEDEYEQRDK